MTRGKTAIALDTPAFTYLVGEHPRYLAACEALFRRIAEGTIRGLASSLVLAELLVPYFRKNDASRARAIATAVGSFPNLVLLPATHAIGVAAARLRAEHNLRTPDAVHVATALEHGAGWFISNDRRLKRVEREGLRVWLFNEHTIADLP